jgi:hypothetical protein
VADFLALLGCEETGAEYHVREHRRDDNECDKHNRCLKAGESIIIAKRFHDSPWGLKSKTLV